MLTPGDPAPWFAARSSISPNFQFDTVAGRYLVLCFFRSAADPTSRQILIEINRNHARFDVEHAAFFGVSTDPEDETQARVTQQHLGIVYFWDSDLTISRAYGAQPPEGPYRPHTLILDLSMRVLAVVSFEMPPEQHVSILLQILAAVPPVASQNGHAPVLIVPSVFELDLCRSLIGLYEQHGGRESGFMRDVEGKTVEITDTRHKRRRDFQIQDQELIKGIQLRLHRRLIPEIKKAFQFNATRIERHIVSCYDSAEEGHFRAHRDNTTLGTAHRRFAVSLNLNAEEFEGGNLRFPEFGRAMYRPPTGGAVVFSCSLLHEATPVTKGKRYAFLPFLYDDAAAVIRQKNAQFVGAKAPSPEA